MEDDKQGVPPPEGEGSPEAGRTVSDAEVVPTPTVEVVAESGLIRRPPMLPPPPPAVSPEGEEEEKMLRKSFMEDLEKLRSRIIRSLYGLAAAFVFALVFAGKLWDIISDPAVDALKHL